MKSFKKGIAVYFMVILLCAVLVSFASDKDLQQKINNNSSARKFLKGYTGEISGETIPYHSPLPEAKHSLLVRSLDRKRFIKWKMEPVPAGYKEDYVTYVWLAGIDVNTDSHRFDLYINDKLCFTFRNPLESKKKDWHIAGKDGAELSFLFTMIDRHNDLFGYMFLKLPAAMFKKRGVPPVVRVQGESAASRSWFMVFKNSIEQKVSLFNEPAVRRIGFNNKPSQQVRIDIVHLGEPAGASIFMGGEKKIASALNLGINRLRLPVPMAEKEKKVWIEVEIEGKKVKKENFAIKPVKKRKIYLLHHSHVDIGYTHLQSEVEQKHWQYFEQAVDLGRRTKDFPSAARFKWNVEVMWAVDSYLEKTAAEPGKQRQFIEAVRNGWIELDATYANELTGLCRPEELMRLFASAREIGKKCGVKVEAAMITDIPGATWGLVPALAHNGVKYLSIGTNHGHRIGHILSTWADHPFYWVSPSGQEKVLCWVAGKGYAYFHTGLGYARLTNRLEEKRIFDYLSELQQANYPYDIVPLHYCIGSDNGPPDPKLPGKVKSWNEKYLTPQLVTATVSETFREFEQQYGGQLPVVKGDFTGCWEDGAASSARETAINRSTAETLVQAETLWTMINPTAYPAKKFREAWRKVLLFDEHTWGSWNSISEPESDFTRQQWRVKQAFAVDGDKLSRELLMSALPLKRQAVNKAPVFDIYNTNSWSRDDLVILSQTHSAGFNRAKDAQGKLLSSQRLSTGELAILVKDVPPLGAKRFFLEKEQGAKKSPTHIEPAAGGKHAGKLANSAFSLNIAESTGAIAVLKYKGIKQNLVAGSKGMGINDYYYVSGRKPDNPQRSGKVKISVKETGPLVLSLLIESAAPGCRRLQREVRLIEGLDRVDIIDIIDKKKIYRPEGVHLAFPFNVPAGIMRIDAAWGVFRPEHDQVPGSCKNYFSVQRWIDISNRDYGITWATIDAPMVEIGNISTDAIVVGWKKHIAPSQTIYSYVMNNYWETNYAAAQEGPMVFRYAIRPHRQFNPAAAERFGSEQSQPLIAAPADRNKPPLPSFLRVEPAGVIATSVRAVKDGKAVMLRLFNAGGAPEQVILKWGKRQPAAIYFSSPFAEKGREIKNSFTMLAYGIVTIIAEFPLEKTNYNR